MAKIKEDSSAVPVNSAGAGNIDGIGVDPKGEPGVRKVRKKLRELFPIIKRKPLEVSA